MAGVALGINQTLPYYALAALWFVTAVAVICRPEMYPTERITVNTPINQDEVVARVTENVENLLLTTKVALLTPSEESRRAAYDFYANELMTRKCAQVQAADYPEEDNEDDSK